jgi:hypothetical protein
MLNPNKSKNIFIYISKGNDEKAVGVNETLLLEYILASDRISLN